MASSLDNLDQMLIKELRTDIRMPCTVLSSKLGVSSVTVRRRLQKLIEDKVISLEVLPHPLKLGYHVTAFMGFRVKLAQAGQAAAQLALNPAFVYLSRTTGFYNLVGYATFRSPEDIGDFMEREVSQIEGIEWYESLVMVRHCKNSLYGVVAGNLPAGEFDSLDKQIVRALQDDVRASYVYLSKRLGVSIPTLQQRLKRMLRERSVAFVPSVDLSKVGYDVSVTIGICANPTLLTEVRRQLEANEQVHGLSMVSGRFNFMLWTYFPDSKHLTGFIQKDLSLIQGIEHYDVLFHTDVLKASWAAVVDLI